MGASALSSPQVGDLGGTSLEQLARHVDSEPGRLAQGGLARRSVAATNRVRERERAARLDPLAPVDAHHARVKDES